VAEDPGETKNLFETREPVAQAMRAKLAGYDTAQGQAPKLPAVDAEALARLAALGYVGSGGAASGRTEGVDPKDRIAELQAYQREMRQSLARFAAGDYAAAARALERLSRTGAPSFNVEYYLGRSLLELRRYAEAVPHLQKAVDMAPARHTLSGLASAPIYARLVEAQAGAGQLPAAFATLDKALAVAPRNAELLRARGSLLLQRGDLPAARAALEQALAADASEVRLHVELSNTYRNLGELQKADAAAREALRRDPKSADAHVANALVAGALGREAEATKLLREALRLSPESPDALFYLGAIELRAGRTAQALPHLEKLVRVAPSYPRGQETLRLARRMAGSASR
jgi:tetratricopeptide (TPR) repeat protein